MKTIVNMIEKLSLGGAFLSAIFMVLIVALIAVEILIRSVFNSSTLISDEYSAYFFVGVVLLGLAFTLKEEGHIRITLLTSVLGDKGRAFLDLFATVLAIVITTFALYYAGEMVYDSWSLGMRADSISETPIYLSQMVIPLGLLMLDLQLGARLLKRFI
ncbi:MAG: TRAP transporter small permease subunit [Desulfobacterales bacterium]|nr:TRAP transporter small permease subunit [Desulfobacterales bacterium]